MNKYIDKWGAYHDKPSRNGKQSSGNPAIYSAYANRLGLDVNITTLKSLYRACWVDYEAGWELKRYPNEVSTKSSRDEIIGWVSLGIMNASDLISWDYRYNYQWLNFPLWKQVKGFIYIAGEHRNFAQDKNVEYVFPKMFQLPLFDQYYVDKFMTGKAKWYKWIMFQLYVISTILQDNISAKNVALLQLEDLNSRWWIRFFDKKKQYKAYFDSSHPFNTELENE